MSALREMWGAATGRELRQADDLRWWNLHRGYSPGTEHDRLDRLMAWGRKRWPMTYERGGAR